MNKKGNNRVIFCHDNRFETKNNKYYSNGIFINDNMERYTRVFETVTVIARKKEVDKTDKLVQIDNDKVEFKCLKGISELFDFKKRQEIKQEVEKADYIIARVPSFIGLLILKYAKKLKKTYLVEVVGDAWGALWNHSFLGKILAPYIEILTKRMIKNAEFVLYVTNKYLQKKYPTKGKNINCSNVELAKTEETILDKRINKITNKKNNTMTIATIAAVDVKYKGQAYVIKAISKLNKNDYNFEYLIVGNGDKTRLLNIAKKEGIEEKVHLLGGLPHDEVFNILDNTDIYIQPSTAAEGLPRAMIEAMSRGCLCIGTNVSGIPELIEKKYIFKKRNVKELITILKEIRKDDFYTEAQTNFYNSRKYEKRILAKRRNKFFKDFLNSINANKENK